MESRSLFHDNLAIVLIKVDRFAHKMPPFFKKTWFDRIQTIILIPKWRSSGLSLWLNKSAPAARAGPSRQPKPPA
jgi:hypothetical protein